MYGYHYVNEHYWNIFKSKDHPTANFTSVSTNEEVNTHNLLLHLN